MDRSESPCAQAELACASALQALPADDADAVQMHVGACAPCQRELARLKPVIDRFVLWPTDILRPPTSLQGRLAVRIAQETGRTPLSSRWLRWSEPDWEEVHRVSILVRLAPGACYPGPTHGGTEELHLLNGKLGIDARRLMLGDYSSAARGSADARVWSKTGCTCLLITSTEDALC